MQTSTYILSDIFYSFLQIQHLCKDLIILLGTNISAWLQFIDLVSQWNIKMSCVLPKPF